MDVRLCYVIIQLYTDLNALFSQMLDYFKLDFIVLDSVSSLQKLCFSWLNPSCNEQARTVYFLVGSDLAVCTYAVPVI